MDWSHPLLALAGLVAGVAVATLLRRRAFRLDVTIRHPKEDDHEPSA